MKKYFAVVMKADRTYAAIDATGLSVQSAQKVCEENDGTRAYFGSNADTAEQAIGQARKAKFVGDLEKLTPITI